MPKMADDTTRLAVAIEANTKQFENAIKKLEKATGQSLRGVNDNAAATGKAFDSLSAKVKSASGDMSRDLAGALSVASGGTIAGALIGGGLAGAVALVKETSQSLAELGAEAKKAGLSVERFQELKYVSAQNVVGLDALTDGIKELQLRADEWIVTGAGPGAEAFQRLGYSADDLSRKLKDPSNLFVEIIGRIGKLNRAAQVRVLDEVFGGTGGERFVGLVDQGEQAIRGQIRAANDLGIVLNEDVIKRAAEIDAKFRVIADVIGSAMKEAVVDVATALVDLQDRAKKIEDQNSRNIHSRLQEIYSEIDLIDQRRRDGTLDALRPSTVSKSQQDEELDRRVAELKEQALKLRDILDRRDGYSENFQFAPEAASNLGKLGGALGTAGTSAVKAGQNFRTFAEGLAALSREIPDLADQLADLDARTRIEATYRATVAKAQTYQEIAEAKRLKDQATTALDQKPAREAAAGGMLDLIAHAEGTAGPGRAGYNETLDYGRWTGGPVRLTGMTLDEIDALQGRMLANPENRARYGGKGSSAVGRYQITQTTLRDLRRQLGLSGDMYFTGDVQDRLAQELLRQRGGSVSGLRGTWTGLQRIDEGIIRDTMAGTELPPVDPSVTAARDAAGDVDGIFARAEAEVAALKDSIGRSADEVERMRHEAQLFDDIARARGGAGLVTPEDLARITDLTTRYHDYGLAFDAAAEKQRAAADAGVYFAETMAGSLSAMIPAIDSGNAALDRLLSSLTEAALQATLLGSGPLAGLFGTAVSGGGTGGLLGALFGGIFGREGGGGVSKGQPYVVGEKRPELFIPETAGRIAPVSGFRAPTIATPRARPSGTTLSVKASINLAGANGDAAIESAARRGAVQAIAAVHQLMPKWQRDADTYGSW